MLFAYNHQSKSYLGEMAQFSLLLMPPELLDAVVSYVGHFTLRLFQFALFYWTHLRIAQLVPCRHRLLWNSIC